MTPDRSDRNSGRNRIVESVPVVVLSPPDSSRKKKPEAVERREPSSHMGESALRADGYRLP